MVITALDGGWYITEGSATKEEVNSFSHQMVKNASSPNVGNSQVFLERAKALRAELTKG